jgi:hypothetical protein
MDEWMELLDEWMGGWIDGWNCLWASSDECTRSSQ